MHKSAASTHSPIGGFTGRSHRAPPKDYWIYGTGLGLVNEVQVGLTSHHRA